MGYKCGQKNIEEQMIRDLVLNAAYKLMEPSRKTVRRLVKSGGSCRSNRRKKGQQRRRGR